jgi:hypothetical protein
MFAKGLTLKDKTQALWRHLPSRLSLILKFEFGILGDEFYGSLWYILML